MADFSNIKALAFDYYGTIADKQGLGALIDAHFPGKGGATAKLWFATCQRYCFQNGMMERHVPWSELTKAALNFAAAETGIQLSEVVRDELIAADQAAPVYDEADAALARLAGKFRLYVLSMASPWMIEQSQAAAGIAGHFSGTFSTEGRQVYKPGHAAYAAGIEEIGLPAEQIAFVSGNSFDVIGSKNFGYPTIWVRRYGQPLDELGPEPDLIVRDLSEMADVLQA